MNEELRMKKHTYEIIYFFFFFLMNYAEMQRAPIEPSTMMQ